MSKWKPQPCADCAANALRIVRAEGQLREAQSILESAARGQAQRSAVRLARKVLRKMSEWVASAGRTAQDEREDVIVYLLDRARAAFGVERALAFRDAIDGIRAGYHEGAADLDRQQLGPGAEFPR